MGKASSARRRPSRIKVMISQNTMAIFIAVTDALIRVTSRNSPSAIGG
jgi:hypothetical protein